MFCTCSTCNNLLCFWEKNIYIPINTYLVCSENCYFKIFCKRCNKYVGVLCNNVCNFCMGGYNLFENNNFKNWLFIYKQTIPFINYYGCGLCNNNNFKNEIIIYFDDNNKILFHSLFS